MIKHQDGRIAMKWAIERRNPKVAYIDGEDKYYVFVPKMNVFMAWVEPEHVARLLTVRDKTCKCDNGRWTNAYTYANLGDVNLWETGDRYGFPNPPYQEITENV